jgi:hypothetical protein
MIVLSRRRSLSRTCTAAVASVLALAIPAGPVHALNTDAAATHPALEIDYQPLGAANPPAADRDAWKVIRTASLPGFGGSYLDRATNVLHVWTTQPSRLSRQQAADVLVGDDQDRVGANGRVQVHRADYTFAELKTWSDRLLRKLFSDDGMALGLTWKDIDERSNSIEVGLEDPSRKAGQLLATTTALGIPQEAITVVKGSPAVPDLQQVRRPLVGGLQILWDLGHKFVCSIGFPAQVGGETGFMTASHCSERPYGGSVGDGYWQPTGTLADPSQNLVASKYLDPPAFACGSQAPAGCRFSDTLFAKREGSVSVSRGFIANASFGVPNWNGSSRYRITDVEPSDPQPGEVRKVGRTTGQTFGDVLNLCRDFLVEVNGGKFGLICQDTAAYFSQGGDSGAPVFRVTSGSDVQLVGIHWGRIVGGEAIFSAWVNIEFEYGSVIVCAPGFAC